jgi:GNAT superfamily N-acetyltransferase
MGSVSEGKPDSAGLKAPKPLGSEHELDSFNSGVDQLDDWLKRHALHNEVDGGSRTFVACAGRRVIGYYSIAAGSVIRGVATNRVRRNMPEPIPVALLGRLAIDQSWQGRGLGADLLRDAVLRMIGVGETIGIRAILVHAISDAAKSFYERHGFRVSPVEPLTLMMTLAEARRMLDGNN